MFLCLTCVSQAFASVHCCLVITCLEEADPSWLLLVMFIVFCYFPIWYPGSGVVLDCIVSCSLPSFLLCYALAHICNTEII